MAEITREEFMTTKTEWDPSKLDDIKGAAERHLQQFPPTRIDATDSFYDSQGNIRANKSDLNFNDTSNTSDGNKREGTVQNLKKSTVQNLEKRRKERKENG